VFVHKEFSDILTILRDLIVKLTSTRKKKKATQTDAVDKISVMAAEVFVVRFLEN